MMNSNIDYYKKYIIYKTKYINLKNEKLKKINLSGGAKWDVLVKRRKKELKNIKNTKSYISAKKLTSKSRIYDIHDNFNRPFRVICNNKGIYVYKKTGENYDQLIIKIRKFQGYWSGYDSSAYKMNGNSILVQLARNKYIFIGWEIYEFTTEDEIIDYISPVGNNDVPYPVAYGTKNVYFMLDKVFIKNEDLETPITVANAEDLYGEFYGWIGSKKGSHQKYKFKNIKIIQKREFS